MKTSTIYTKKLVEIIPKYKVIEVYEGIDRTLFMKEKVKVFILQDKRTGDIVQRWIYMPNDSKRVK